MTKKLKFFISLITAENDYQLEQARAAQTAAHKMGIDVRITYAENDSITQSTQILQQVQAMPSHRPHAVIFEPVGGTGLPQVARAAVHAGIGWAILSRDAPYVDELRRSALSPVFGVSSDQIEVGRISENNARRFYLVAALSCISKDRHLVKSHGNEEAVCMTPFPRTFTSLL